MKRFFQLMMATWRAGWLAWLRLLTWPWRWLTRLLGLGRPSDAPGDNRSEPAAGPQARPDAAARTGGRPADVGVETGAATRDNATTDADTAVRRPVDSGVDPEIDSEVDPEVASGLAAAAGDDAAGRRSNAALATAPAPARPAHPPGLFEEATFHNDAGERRYKLYVPAAKPAGPVPLVVMLHGCKQDPDDFAAGTRMNLHADEQAMLVLYPAQARSANSYACWNWFGKHDQHRGEGEPSLIAGMVLEVLARHPVDPRRVYVAGLSAGGAMAATLAHTYPDLFAAAGIHSGLPYGAAQDAITALGVMKRGLSGPLPTLGPRADESLNGAKSGNAASGNGKSGSAKRNGVKNGVPVIVFHGDHDNVVHPLNGERVVEQALLSARGATARDSGHPAARAGRVPGGHAYTRTAYTNRAGQVHVEHWVVQGSGHAWSGGDKAGSFTDPLGPDASAEMLRFFLEHPKA